VVDEEMLRLPSGSWLFLGIGRGFKGSEVAQAAHAALFSEEMALVVLVRCYQFGNCIGQAVDVRLADATTDLPLVQKVDLPKSFNGSWFPRSMCGLRSNLPTAPASGPEATSFLSSPFAALLFCPPSLLASSSSLPLSNSASSCSALRTQSFRQSRDHDRAFDFAFAGKAHYRSGFESQFGRGSTQVGVHGS
jgi:hypothetical protein